jgi:hypothetical protein
MLHLRALTRDIRATCGIAGSETTSIEPSLPGFRFAHPATRLSPERGRKAKGDLLVSDL